MLDLIANGKEWAVGLVEQSAGSRQRPATSIPENKDISANQPYPPALHRMRLATQTPEELLQGLPLNRDDWNYVKRFLLGRSHSAVADILAQYRNAWETAAQAEPLPHRKENAGRFAANVWLRHN